MRANEEDLRLEAKIKSDMEIEMKRQADEDAKKNSRANNQKIVADNLLQEQEKAKERQRQMKADKRGKGSYPEENYSAVKSYVGVENLDTLQVPGNQDLSPMKQQRGPTPLGLPDE